MAQSTVLPLALLYVDGSREIDGATRFQKLIFIAQQETPLGQPFDYREDKYGPFSPELYATLDELERRNLIEKNVRTNRSGNEKYTYHLTPQGRRAVQDLREKIDEDTFNRILQEAQKVKTQYNEMPLDRLLRYVYSKYPEYTSESELDEFKPSD
jgi:uncharacterized protein YwgA